jgi:hypothetical protein
MNKIVSYLLQFLVIFALISLFVWFKYSPWIWILITFIGAFYALRAVKYYFDID